MTVAKPENPYARTYREFTAQTRDHALRVLHDDGLYRHLRVQAPGTRIWSWDIVTWPGHLATSGDIADGYTFTREPDMLRFFSFAGKTDGYYADGAPSIDFRYWAEKLCGGRSRDVKVYEPDEFLRQVREALQENEHVGLEADTFRDRKLTLLERLHTLRGLDGNTRAGLLAAHQAALELSETWAGSSLRTHVRDAQDHAWMSRDALWSTAGLTDDQIDDLIDRHDWYELADSDIPRQPPAERREETLDDARLNADDERQAYEWLADNEDRVGFDTWEWDLRAWDTSFLYACYAIDLTTRLWREHTATAPETA